MSDLLSAAGLLLAIVTMLYSLWYREMEDAAARPVPLHDWERPQREVRGVWRNKALPLLVATLLLTVVLAKDAVCVCVGAVGRLWRDGLGAAASYDAVRTAFVLVTIGAGFMAARALAAARGVRRKLKEFKSKSEERP